VKIFLELPAETIYTNRHAENWLTEAFPHNDIDAIVSPTCHEVGSIRCDLTFDQGSAERLFTSR
jgi:5'(3')-deoxyribonucleotidase